MEEDPNHDFSAFEKACQSHPETVVVPDDTESDARRHFRINNSDDLLAFIGRGGLKDHKFVKRDTWRFGKEAYGVEVNLDIYDFWEGEKFGYLSLGRHPENSMWVIKSFHENTNPNPRAKPVFKVTKRIVFKKGVPHEE
ncbi:MAG: hypothetical protein AB7F66_04675 [Bacteriovoracia bacterium]